MWLYNKVHSLLLPTQASSNLQILPSGSVPPNPAELLARPSLDKAITQLSQEFDYVILDTAPVGMVTDTLIMSRVANATVYVCRADYSYKSDFGLINELKKKTSYPKWPLSSTEVTPEVKYSSTASLVSS